MSRRLASRRFAEDVPDVETIDVLGTLPYPDIWKSPNTSRYVSTDAFNLRVLDPETQEPLYIISAGTPYYEDAARGGVILGRPSPRTIAAHPHLQNLEEANI